MSNALKQTSFDRGAARELLLVLTASDNMATYRCDATNEAMQTISAHTQLKVNCELDGSSDSHTQPDLCSTLNSAERKAQYPIHGPFHRLFLHRFVLFVTILAVSSDSVFFMVFPVTAVSMKISTHLEVLRRGQMLTLECQAGSSNPKANISWSLGGLRFVKAWGGHCRQGHACMWTLYG